MEQNLKELLLKDICSRLPYNVTCQFNDSCRVIDSLPQPIYDGVLSERSIDLFRNHVGFTIKPYLRPLSSMTEREYNEYENYIALEYDELAKFKKQTIFYNKHHLDYNGLIPKELALEAPKDMYNV